MKKFFIGVFAAALIGFSALGVERSFNNDANISQLTLENLEALADGKGHVDDRAGAGGRTFTCKWYSTTDDYGEMVFCVKTGTGNTCTCGDVKRLY